MRMKIDETLCSGHGRCAKFAPNVYTLDDSGYNADVGQVIAVPTSEEDNATKGRKACPERAITEVEG